MLSQEAIADIFKSFNSLSTGSTIKDSLILLSSNVALMSILIPMMYGTFSRLLERTINLLFKILDKGTNLIVETIGFVFRQLIHKINFSKKKRSTDYNGFVINLTNPSRGYFSRNDEENISDNALPILWWLSLNCDFVLTKMISSSVDMKTGKLIQSYYGRESGKSVNTFLPLPVTTKNDEFDDIDEAAENKDKSKSKKTKPRPNPTGLQSRNIHVSAISDLLVDDLDSIEIDKDIYCKFIPCGAIQAKTDENQPLVQTDTTMILLKSKKPTKYIQEFIAKVSEDYKKYVAEHQDLNRALLIYMSLDKEVPLYTEYKYDNSQTFDHMFFENKKFIMEMLDKLKQPELFKKNGRKRKVSMLFVGPPGSCKTSAALAIAAYTNRVLIQVPITRIKYSREIEKVLYNEVYNRYDIPNDKKVILFDEIDSIDFNLKKSIDDTSSKKDNDNSKETTESTDSKLSNKVEKSDETKPKDDFNIGSFLSLLDGANDQDGMIIIATANDISKFDDSLYRPGRLTKIDFGYMSNSDITDMIEKYFEKVVTSEQKERIRNDRIIHSDTLKNICLDFIDKRKSIDEYIEHVNKLTKK